MPKKPIKPKNMLYMGGRPSKNIFNNIFFYIFIALAIYILVTSVGNGLATSGEQIPVGQFIKLLREQKVQNVTIAGDRAEILLKDGTKLVTEKESSISFDDIFKNNQIDTAVIEGELKVEHRIGWEDVLSPLLMFGFPILLLLFLFRQMKGASGDIMSFGKSRAKVFNKKLSSQITFKDIAGNDEAKQDMMEIVDFLKQPKKYRKLGARTPKGVLLVGPSGVGKTLLAKAIAGEAGVPFFSVAGSEFMEMLVGVGSSRVRDLFNNARQSQPSLIFIDEIDAIGRQRGMGIGGGHDEREQTLNQILIEMDGFDTRTDVIVIAATNRPDMLDPALVRPGRFDRKINIPLPDLKAREEIIKIHMRGKPFVEGVDVVRIARKTVGFSGADIENMINEAAIKAAREDRDKVNAADVDEASLKVTMGSERKTLQTEEERQMTAYHEAGHALVAATVPDMDPVQRVSIVARGGSLGHTSISPDRDRYNETKTRLLSTIATMLGGRAAEEVVYHEQTVGAGDDIKKATSLARRMVTEFGMSDLGPIMYDTREDSIWLARELGEAHRLSEKTSAQVDDKVKEIVDSCYAGAKSVLEDKRKTLDRIAKALMEKETIDQDEFEKLIK
ncbi:MAG TPA: ATP-dependent zinc metalloprotease FtsH [Patescibacteria group bacterium]|nr:ATP-dependent zinc metalloprotease FtsH [Patescibacteria group bacterium]